LGDKQLLELGELLRWKVAEGFDQRKRGCPGGISYLRRLSVAQRQALAYRLVAVGENSAETGLTVSGRWKREAGGHSGRPLQS
jgi:hypothetical protein